MGLYWGLYTGYIRVLKGLCRDNGKEHGNYYLGFTVIGF